MRREALRLAPTFPVSQHLILNSLSLKVEVGSSENLMLFH